MEAGPTLAPGRTLADFRVASLLRSVDGATVYAAEQTALGRRVALVVSSAPGDSEPGARFSAIARRLAALDHPHVLPVYEVGSAEGTAFAAVREPPGRALDAFLREGPLTPERSAALAEQLTGALDAIDRAGIGPIELAPRDVFVSSGDDVHVAALEAALASTSAPDARTTVTRLLSSAAVSPPPATRRRGVLVGAAVVVAAAAGAAVVIAALSGSADEGQRQAVAPRAPADAPGARLVATIPLNGTPGSSTVDAGAVWVATAEGNVLRVDPTTNRVVGAPIRFAPSDRRNNVTVRAGAGAVFALDGNRGRIVRIDPRSGRITRRRTLGGLLGGAAVSGGVLWVLRWDMPRSGRPIDELLRLDAVTLRPVGHPFPIGRPIRLGPQAFDVEAEHGMAWVTNSVDGTVTRFDSHGDVATTVRAALQPIDSALHDGTLWVPDVGGGALVPVDARMRVGDSAMHSDYPLSVASTRDALWVVANTTNTGPGGPARLYRIDPRSRAVLGAPVDLGQDVGWLAAGAGAVWVRSLPKHALLKFVATSPAPAAVRAAAPRAGPRPVAAGPVGAGTWASGHFPAPFTFSVAAPGWLLLEDGARSFTLGPVGEPLADIVAYAPRQAFTPSGDVRRLRTPKQAVDLVTSNPHVRVLNRRRTSLGGVPATELSVRVRRYQGYPGFCGSPCVVLYGLPAGSGGLEADKAARMWFLRHNQRTVVVVAEADARRPDFGPAEALLRTLRFR